FFFSSRRRHTRFSRDWSSDVCSSDLLPRNTFDPNNQAVLPLTKNKRTWKRRKPPGNCLLPLACSLPGTRHPTVHPDARQWLRPYPWLHLTSAHILHALRETAPGSLPAPWHTSPYPSPNPGRAGTALY